MVSGITLLSLPSTDVNVIIITIKDHSYDDKDDDDVIITILREEDDDNTVRRSSGSSGNGSNCSFLPSFVCITSSCDIGGLTPTVLR